MSQIGFTCFMFHYCRLGGLTVLVGRALAPSVEDRGFESLKRLKNWGHLWRHS